MIHTAIVKLRGEYATLVATLRTRKTKAILQYWMDDGLNYLHKVQSDMDWTVNKGKRTQIKVDLELMREIVRQLLLFAKVMSRDLSNLMGVTPSALIRKKISTLWMLSRNRMFQVMCCVRCFAKKKTQLKVCFTQCARSSNVRSMTERNCSHLPHNMITVAPYSVV